MNITPNAFYKHKNGDTVKVLSVQFNRITFIRVGYFCPVVLSENQFSKEYIYLGSA
ncbi:DUF4222 domain-containing protein [Providencia rettgeri]|uniref:DUF4222 domain-containing protein n=1 Tax=Providencia rettgeri TaxID=587 RepID=UPI003015F1BF